MISTFSWRWLLTFAATAIASSAQAQLAAFDPGKLAQTAIFGVTLIATAEAQGPGKAGLDSPYSLLAEVRSLRDGAVLTRPSFRCRSMLIRCEGIISVIVEGRPVAAKVSGFAEDGLHLRMQIEPPLRDQWFDRVGFDEMPARSGQEREIQLTKYHLSQPPTAIVKVLIRIED